MNTTTSLYVRHTKRSLFQARRHGLTPGLTRIVFENGTIQLFRIIEIPDGTYIQAPTAATSYWQSRLSIDSIAIIQSPSYQSRHTFHDVWSRTKYINTCLPPSFCRRNRKTLYLLFKAWIIYGLNIRLESYPQAFWRNKTKNLCPVKGARGPSNNVWNIRGYVLRKRRVNLPLNTNTTFTLIQPVASKAIDRPEVATHRQNAEVIL